MGLLWDESRPERVPAEAPLEDVPPANGKILPEDVDHAEQGTLVRAKVLEILPPLAQYEARTPCGETSCQVMALIEEVVRRGDDPASLLTAGNEVRMQFSYTLKPADAGYFPMLNVAYPGLEINDRFEAVLEGGRSNMQANRIYTVGHYLKIL